MSLYTEHRVDPRLAPYVACYWSHDFGGDARSSHAVLPDGCIDLLFESGAGSLDVVGTMTRTLWADHYGPAGFVAVRFKAGGAVPFCCDRADHFTDKIAEAAAVFGPAGSRLKQRLLEGGSVAARVRLLEEFLLGRLEAGAACVDARIAWATSSLTGEPGRQIDGLARDLGVSRQYVRRLFLQHTGLSPKAFARVARLRRLVEFLGSGAPLADASLAAGYADQAHMGHEFKDLVGIPPGAYQGRY